MIEIKDLTFRYPTGGVIFEQFTWLVKRGEAWSVIGPSGCGKSTLLMLIAGLYKPAEGTVLIAGERLVRPRPRTGLILQDYGLLPWATVWDNAALGLEIRGFYGPDGKHTPLDEKTESINEQVQHWLTRLKIANIAHHYPNQISGGQRQRTAIARTLAMNPDLILMDEPFGALDTRTREDLQILTLELWSDQHLTTIIVTHNIEEAAITGQKILVLGHPPNRQAQIVENPAAGQLDYRKSTEYLHQCNALRAMMDERNHEIA